jgi:hypothetical protein
MDRRAALARLAAITGSIALGGELFVTGCRRTDKRAATPFTASDVALLDEIGETILPTTDTPGAKSVGIGAFMTMMVSECYDDDAHAAFQSGLADIDAASRSRHGRLFLQCTASERHEILSVLDREQAARKKNRGEMPHYFTMMKELTLLGYFSSETGCTKALRYAETPGAYDGDVPYHKGERAWFDPTRRVG